MRTFFAFLLPTLIFAACASTPPRGGEKNPTKSIADERKNCWQEKDAPTLLSVMERVMAQSLEQEYVRDNYIQTFGCAYEEVIIEKNAIQAVYRAILQSLKNRNVTARDDLQALLQSRPPRPDNLVRDYTIYVNLPESARNGHGVASYQVKILQLEVVHTVESPVTIWCRVATRFSHREDHFRALPVSAEKSEFVKILKKAQQVLQQVERGRMDEVMKFFPNSSQTPVHLVNGLDDLVFGDLLKLVDLSRPHRSLPAIFLGKGILFGATRQNKSRVFKLGEEQRAGLRIDFRNIRRATPEFKAFGYKAPEAILQCLYLKDNKKRLLQRY